MLRAAWSLVLLLIALPVARGDERVDALLEQLRGGNDDAREAAAHSLVLVGRQPEQVVPALIATLLPAPPSWTRHPLPRIRCAPEHVLPHLLAAWRDPRFESSRVLLADALATLLRRELAPDREREVTDALADAFPASRDPKVLERAGTALTSWLRGWAPEPPSERTARAKAALAAAPAALTSARDDQDFARAEALIDVLGQCDFDPAPEGVAAALGACLQHPTLQEPAARALAQLGPRGASARPALRAWLESETEAPSTQALAAYALVRLGEPPDPLVAWLIAKLDSPAPAAREATGTQLAALGPIARAAVPRLVVALEGKDAEEAGHAMKHLASLGEAAHGAVPAMLRWITHGDEGVRYRVVDALEDLDVRTPEVVAALERAVSGSDDFLARSALRLLIEWKLVGPSLLAVLVAAVEAPDSGLGKRAVEALPLLGSDTPSTRPLLLKALDHVDPSVRADAIEGLRLAGVPAAVIVPRLSKELGALEWQVRQASARALAELVPADAAPAVPDLLALFERADECWEVRGAAAYAFCRLASDPAPGLACLQDGLANPTSAHGAARMLAKLGRIAEPATAALRQALVSARLESRIAAGEALLAIHPRDKEATAILLAHMADPRVSIAHRTGAARILAQYPDLRERSMAFLRETALSTEHWARWYARDAIRRAERRD